MKANRSFIFILYLLLLLNTSTPSLSQTYNISIPNIEVPSSQTQVTIPINVAENLTGQNITSYQGIITWDNNIIQYSGHEHTGTISEPWGTSGWTQNSSSGYLNFGQFVAQPALEDSGTIVKLIFNIVGSAGDQTSVEFNSFYLNAYQANTTNGSVTIRGTTLPILSVNPTTIDFGTTETQKSFNISNLGGGTLNWQVTESVSWIISVNPISGTNSGTVTVTISRSGLAEGDYSGIISVKSNGGDKDVTVYMKVSQIADYFFDDFEDGIADGWLPNTPSRWSVVQDEGDYSYFLNSTGYSGGERTMLQGYTFDNFELTLKTKSAENLNQIINATYTVHFCYQNEENYYSVKFCQYNPENKLYRKKDNQTVVLASYNGTTINDNYYHEIKLKKDGNNITVYFDQQQIMNAADSALSSGQIGLGAWQNSAYFDDILIVSEITDPILSVSPNIRNIDYSGGSNTFSVSNIGGGTMNWSASVTSGSIWLHITSGNSGINDGTIYFRVDNNSSTSKRTGEIKVNAPGATGSPKFVYVEQEGVQPFTLWQVPITIKGGTTTFTRTFGGDANAKGGFDSLDVAAAPPGMSYYTYFELPVFPNYLETDIRKWTSPYDTEITWILKIVKASGITSSLSWNQSDLPQQGTFTLNVNGVDLNMKNENSATAPGDANLEIKYTLNDVVNYNFSQQGWYLISLPVTPTNNSLSTLFPTALAAFAYNSTTGAYYSVSSLETKKGYWLLIPGATNVTISGARLNSYTAHYITGWHLIGSVMGTTNFVNPNDNPNGSVISAYGYNPTTGNYFAIYPPGTGKLEEKQGYWLAVIQSCDLTIGSSTISKATITAVGNKELLKQQFGNQPPAPPFIADKILLPNSHKIMSRNYPNPFNPETIIEYSLPKEGPITVCVYNSLGQKIRTLVDELQQAGIHKVIWDGRNDKGKQVTNGIYFYTIISFQLVESEKMLLLR